MKLMKIAIDERIKHRVTGVLVLVSIAIIFVPAMIKKSNQRFAENISVSVKLPPKPIFPKVSVVEKKAIFEEVKVARLDIPMDTPKVTILPGTPVEILNAKPNPIAKQTPKTLVQPVKLVKSNPIKTQPGLQGAYVVQLASFIQQKNAEVLVARLRSQGYQADYKKYGDLYKVVVGGQLTQRNDAQMLQKKLAKNMQLSGFIIKNQVS